MGFTRVVGAFADVRELEYISALQQTCPGQPRENGTVSSLDIQRHLISRHSMMVSHKEAVQIVRGLGGGNFQEELVQRSVQKARRLILRGRSRKKSKDVEEQDTDFKAKNPEDMADADIMAEEYLDLVQMLSIILIPTFAAADKDPELVSSVLQILLRDLKRSTNGEVNYAQEVGMEEGTGQETEREKVGEYVINEDIVRKILVTYGEGVRAQDNDLVSEMVSAARSTSGVLDRESLVMAMTSDIQLWDVNSLNRQSSFVDDVQYTAQLSVDNTAWMEQVGEDEQEDVKEESWTKLTGLDDPSNTDLIVDQHTSLVLTVLIWVYYVTLCLTYTQFLFILTAADCTDTNEAQESICLFGRTIASWLVVAFCLSMCTLLVIVPLSSGNNPKRKSKARYMTSFIASVVFTIIPFMVLFAVRKNSEEPYTDVEKQANSILFTATYYGSLGIGCVLTVIYLLNVCASVRPESDKGIEEKLPLWRAASNVIAEYRLKQAARKKIERMLSSALELHQSNPSNAGGAVEISNDTDVMLNYAAFGRSKEEVGIVWIFQSLYSGSIFNDEGLWFPSRLYMIQIGQMFVIITLSVSLFFFTDSIADRAEEAYQEVIEFQAADNLPLWFDDVIPRGSQVRAAFYPAAVCSFLVIFALFIVYVPSAVGTLMEYRNGTRPSLGSATFLDYRKAVDMVHMNLANALYCLLVCGALVYAAVGIVLLLYLWDLTSKTMVTITAWVIAICVTTGVKFVMTLACRFNFYKGYYRIRPRSANLATLMLEGWYLGSGVGSVITRASLMFLAAIVWLGRVDVRFLDPQVKLFGYAFDVAPHHFLKELMAHEAHRHPFVERLAQMYLMKLLHKDKFCSDAGAVWRQIFVLALMPWLKAHRVSNETRVIQATASSNLRRKEDEENLYA